MELIENKENNLRFKSEISYTLANAIRRYVNEVPILAIDEVEISKNDSPLYDETVAHRIGLIPIKMESGKNSLKISLAVKREGYVVSGDFSPAKVVYDKIPITILDKGQELEVVAEAKLGKGNEHAKYSPGFISYRGSLNPEDDKDSKELIISVESFGQISPKEIFIQSLDCLKKDFLEVAKKLK